MLVLSDEKEVINYLKDQTLYGEFIGHLDFDQLAVDYLEAKARQFVFQRYEKLVHYFTDEHRKLFKMLFMRYEVENLKLLLRAIYRNENIERITNELMVSALFSKIDYEDIGRSKTVEELVLSLKDTPYYRVLIPYINENPNRLMFYMEMNLDRIYFKLLGEQIKRLSGDDREPMLELLGRNTDILNIQWIYRGLKFYKLSPEELFNYCLGNGYMKFKKLKEFCYSKNEDEFIDQLRSSKYHFLFEDVETVDQFMERSMERYLYKVLTGLEKKKSNEHYAFDNFYAQTRI